MQHDRAMPAPHRLPDRAGGPLPAVRPQMAASVSPVLAVRQDGRRAFGLSFPTLGWADSLAMLEAAAELRVGCRAVTFLTLSGLLRALINPLYRARLGGHVLLPADRAVTVLLRLVRPRAAIASLTPDRFVPSLLTFMDHRRRILLIGADRSRLEAARRRLKAHAPWHDISTLAMTGPFPGRAASPLDAALEATAADMVIADARDEAEERRLEDFLAFRHDGLLLLASEIFRAAGNN
ncbi:hypothetical protein SAMN05880590_101812 [Rhizobium sp. RU35A]|nr:hypothetical protein SAMN05880590_101812 [Rhizobium sp. RU35A]